MKTVELSWQNKKGLKFYVLGWEPDRDLKAVVATIHGLGEHMGRYAHVGEAFGKAGYALVGFDLRGHGRSEGARGHTPSYAALLDDTAEFLDWLRARYPGKPLFLYGHSLGGNLVLNYALQRKSSLAGVISTAPWLKLAFQPPRAQVVLGRLMNGIAPGFTQKSGLETAALSRDPAVEKAYVSDPLVHDKISARLFVGLYDSGAWALEHAAEFPLPLLLMHGSLDRLTSPDASRLFAERAGKKVTLRIWEGYFHEIHNEPEKAQVLKVMTDWIDGVISKK